jgi:hypothetical protein
MMQELLINFIQQVCSSELIYSLKNKDSYASVESNYEVDENETPIEAMCVWSSLEKTKENQIDDWSDYEIETIPVEEFLENWCIGIFNDGLIFCIDADLTFDAYEIQPIDLAYKIATILPNKEKYDLNKFVDMDDYIQKIKPLVIE